ncbi:MAG: hypothetical protein WDW38_002953 [Sanguina aurantia]
MCLPILQTPLQRIGILYKELTPEQKKAYADTAAKLSLESASQRAAAKVLKVQQFVPTNAYLLFCHEKFPALKAADPSIKLVDIIKKIAVQWRGLSESEKQVLKARVVTLKAGSMAQ